MQGLETQHRRKISLFGYSREIALISLCLLCLQFALPIFHSLQFHEDFPCVDCGEELSGEILNSHQPTHSRHDEAFCFVCSRVINHRNFGFRSVGEASQRPHHWLQTLNLLALFSDQDALHSSQPARAPPSLF